MPSEDAIVHVVAAVLEGRPSTLSAEIGLRSQKVLTACYESARCEKVVQLG